MFKQLCALVSAVTLTALGEPSDPIRLLNDSNQCDEVFESLINSEVVNDNTRELRFITGLHVNNLIEIVDISQDQNLNKKTEKINMKIGTISETDFMLLCQLVAAEAEDQPFEGKRAVVAVVLNRVDYGDPFEGTIEGVIFQENQFSCINDGRFFAASEYVSEEDQEAVWTELAERSDPEILFFTAGDYGAYGTPAYSIGDHYFCTK